MFWPYDSFILGRSDPGASIPDIGSDSTPLPPTGPAGPDGFSPNISVEELFCGLDGASEPIGAFASTPPKSLRSKSCASLIASAGLVISTLASVSAPFDSA